MILALQKVQKFVWSLNPKPVILAGHSLGGMQVRFASTLIPRNQIEKLILLFSPSVTHIPPKEERLLFNMARFLSVQVFLDDLACIYTACFSEIWRKTALINYVSLYQGTRLKNFFGAPNFDRQILEKSVDGYMYWEATKEILADISNASFESPNGEDLIQKWVTMKNRPPTISFVGGLDKLAVPTTLKAEANELGYQYRELSVGHAGAFVDSVQLYDMARAFSE